ncbi:hypothetical protein O8C96_04350 [Aliarcobacter butzleri]|uniref:hypothetical protein n=1 Tax=Aliarcobacter butzleri TaxID=28197 RepID=UPI00263C3F3F|nr:hypothetical protein [Aliarcobacter butzleri]MDN5044952.1 hypothetical protein [Aliarcobacter butzleri]
MNQENKERLLKIYKQIEPVMDDEIGWGNPLLNMLIAISIDMYKQNINKDVDVEDLLLFVDYSGIIKIYKNIKPVSGVMNDGNHLIASDEHIALNMIENKDEKDYKYFINELYKLFLGYEDENILKRVCRRLDLTYAQLAEQIGYSEGNINKVASTGNISEPLKKAIELYLRNLELEKQLEDYEAFKTLIRKAIN